MIKAQKAAAVTPHATDALPEGGATALYVGGAGTVICRTRDAAADTTFTVPAGGYIWCAVSHVRTGGTATLIVALY